MKSKRLARTRESLLRELAETKAVIEVEAKLIKGLLRMALAKQSVQMRMT